MAKGIYKSIIASIFLYTSLLDVLKMVKDC
jgi:hypothetical protein